MVWFERKLKIRKEMDREKEKKRKKRKYILFVVWYGEKLRRKF